MAAQGGKHGRNRARAWRWGTPLATAAAGALMAVSAVNSHGTDLRPGRYTDLSALAADEARDSRALQNEVATLNRENQALRQQIRGAHVDRAQRAAEALMPAAGLEAVSGPGVKVTLHDAPLAISQGDPEHVNDHLVHQQDIQAVVNALWASGAKAITLQGQRIITTTGIKCQGNSVQIQSGLYPEPYVIEAVGDPTTLQNGLDSDPNVYGYQLLSQDPKVAVGWAFERMATVAAPAYDGVIGMNYARVATP